MTKYNMCVVAPDMKARMELMMNIYHHLMKLEEDAIPHKTSADYGSLNGYINLMQCATKNKKNKKLKKTCLHRSVAANRTINVLSAQKNNKNSSSSSSISSRPMSNRSVLFNCENSSAAAYFEDTKKLLWTGCKTVDDALDVNRDLPMWVQTVDSNNIVKQMLASTENSRIDKGNIHTLVAVLINFSITMMDMFGMNAGVNKNWLKYSSKIIKQLINDIKAHYHSKDPNTALKVKGKNGNIMLNKALSTITQLKKIVPNDKLEGHVVQNPIVPLTTPLQQPTYPTPLPDYNAQQYVNYNYSNQNYVNGYNYQAPYQPSQINRPPYCSMQYRPPYQPPFQQYSSQVRVNQPQYYQYLQQPPNPWSTNYQKQPYPMHNTPFPPTQFVTNPQLKPEAKLVEVKEDDEQKWLEAQKNAKKIVNNTINHNILASRSTDSTQSSQESEEGLINNLHAAFEKISDRDNGASLPDDTDRMWNFLAREVDKKVRYKFQKMIREMQDIPKEEFSRDPELYDSTYQHVVKIQLFEPIRCKMINKQYENVQVVVQDFRLVFGTFRQISQAEDIKYKLLMDLMERHFNECLRKYFRGWNLDKYHPGVIDIL